MKFFSKSFGRYWNVQCDTKQEALVEARKIARTTNLPAHVFHGWRRVAIVHVNGMIEYSEGHA